MHVSFQILTSINASCGYVNKPLGAAFLHLPNVNLVIENLDPRYTRFLQYSREKEFKRQKFHYCTTTPFDTHEETTPKESCFFLFFSYSQSFCCRVTE